MDIVKMLNRKFEEQNIIVHPDFLNEFLDIISKSDCKERIICKFLEILNIANILGINMCRSKKIEHLDSNSNLYSLHVDVKKYNLRILFSLEENDKLLLHTFFEKSGKSNTAYVSHIPIATKRRNEYFSDII